MPMTAKVVSLAVALTCSGAIRPLPENILHRSAIEPSPSKCRIYFGCAPVVRTGTAVAQKQEYGR
jgi:hypothetical protein